jgi:hypothetical protein
MKCRAHAGTTNNKAMGGTMLYKFSHEIFMGTISILSFLTDSTAPVHRFPPEPLRR